MTHELSFNVGDSLVILLVFWFVWFNMLTYNKWCARKLAERQHEKELARRAKQQHEVD